MTHLWQLPPSDLSDLDPRHERPRQEEVDFYREMGFLDWEADYTWFINSLEDAA